MFGNVFKHGHSCLIYYIDCVDESIMFDGDKIDLEVSRDHRQGWKEIQEDESRNQKSDNERDKSSSPGLGMTRHQVSNMFFVLIVFRNNMS